MSTKTETATLRCASYCRVSTVGQTEGNYSSLEHQREAIETFIYSKESSGWIALNTSYNDTGTGASLERPALAQLLQDVADGLVDAVAVYRLDRITRSIFDFAKIIKHLNKHNCAFISISEQFDTSTPQGKLHLNMMLSFSEFERELIAARTRDKVIAARKRGRWTGGPVPLGYNLMPNGGGLAVNKDEAERVQAIFSLYTDRESLTETLAELRRRHWQTKSWTTKRGHVREGAPFQKGSLRRLLSNPIFIGKVLCRGEVYDGLHELIVDRDLWDRVQRILETNGSNGGSQAKNKHGALLKGILRCASCNAAMTHTFTHKNGRQYRYYTCVHAQKHGWSSCPTKSIPAAEIERVIVERVQAIGTDPDLVKATIKAAREQIDKDLRLVQADIKTCERDLARLRKEEKKIFPVIGRGGTVAQKAAERLEEIGQNSTALQERLKDLNHQSTTLREQVIDPEDLTAALATFDEIWEVLLPRERARVVKLLIQQVDFNGDTGTLGITFHPTGIKALLAETE